MHRIFLNGSSIVGRVNPSAVHKLPPHNNVPHKIGSRKYGMFFLLGHISLPVSLA
jgi:hypothetical protein